MCLVSVDPMERSYVLEISVNFEFWQIKFVSNLSVSKFSVEIRYFTPSSIPEIIWVKNVRAIVVCGFLMKSLKKQILKI